MTAAKKTSKDAQTKTTDAQVVEAVETVAAASKEAVDLAVKTSNEVTGKSYEQAVSVTKEHVEAASKAAGTFKGYEDVIAFHKGNFEAALEASSIWINGIQDINKAIGAFAGKSVEQGAESTKKLLSCKSVEEVMALNSETAKTSYDVSVAETKNIHEMSIKLAESSAKPLASRINETVARFSKPLAA